MSKGIRGEDRESAKNICRNLYLPKNGKTNFVKEVKPVESKRNVSIGELKKHAQFPKMKMVNDSMTEAAYR
jgi:hypothetical protein